MHGQFRYVTMPLTCTLQLPFYQIRLLAGKSNHIFLQPLLPLFLGPTTRNFTIYNTVKYDGRRDMNPNQSIHLDLRLHIRRDTISCIQRTILSRLITNLQQLVHLTLIHAHTPRNLSKPLIRIITRLVDDISIEEILLLGEERRAEGIEVRRAEF